MYQISSRSVCVKWNCHTISNLQAKQCVSIHLAKNCVFTMDGGRQAQLCFQFTVAHMSFLLGQGTELQQPSTFCLYYHHCSFHNAEFESLLRSESCILLVIRVCNIQSFFALICKVSPSLLNNQSQVFLKYLESLRNNSESAGMAFRKV